jgi:hypothetical protein
MSCSYNINVIKEPNELPLQNFSRFKTPCDKDQTFYNSIWGEFTFNI